MANVLILDGHCSAALAFVRSLGRAGHKVIVGSENRFFTPTTRSRYCKKSYYYPSPVEGVDAFLSTIHSVVEKENIDAVFPMTDITVWPLSFRRSEFNEKIIAAPDSKVIDLVSDKYRTIELAKELGVPVPQTMLVNSEEDFDRLFENQWKYPIVIKDRFSMRWENDKGTSGGVEFAYSDTELEKKLRDRLQDYEDIIVQEFTAGVGVGFACFSLDGEVYMPFQWERIREKDPRGSGSSARKSQKLDSDILDYSKKLIIASGFKGISMVEFKRNPQTGELSLMEINGRPWGSIQLPVHAGYDYPKVVADWLLEKKIPKQHSEYKNDITCRWLVADLIHLENVKEGRPPEWPMPYPDFFRAVFDVLIPWYPGLRYDHFSWDDPKPGFAELYYWLNDRLFQKLKKLL